MRSGKNQGCKSLESLNLVLIQSLFSLLDFISRLLVLSLETFLLESLFLTPGRLVPSRRSLGLPGLSRRSMRPPDCSTAHRTIHFTRPYSIVPSQALLYHTRLYHSLSGKTVLRSLKKSTPESTRRGDSCLTIADHTIPFMLAIPHFQAVNNGKTQYQAAIPRFLVTGLHPFTTYSFRVAAANKIGVSAPSKESFQTMTHRESELKNIHTRK